jgi:hypothetical protein
LVKTSAQTIVAAARVRPEDFFMMGTSKGNER